MVKTIAFTVLIVGFIAIMNVDFTHTLGMITDGVNFLMGVTLDNPIVLAFFHNIGQFQYIMYFAGILLFAWLIRIIFNVNTLIDNDARDREIEESKKKREEYTKAKTEYYKSRTERYKNKGGKNA